MQHVTCRPKLLVFTQWFSPGYRAGGPIRSTTNLVSLLQDRFDIRVVTSDRDLGLDEGYPGITPDEWTAHGNARVIYLSPAQQTYRRIAALIADDAPDTVYLNSMFSPRFTLLPLLHLWRSAAHRRVVIAPRGELLPGAMQYKRLKKSGLLSALRLSGGLKAAEFHATDEQEQSAVVGRLGIDPGRVHVLANVPEPPASAVAPITKSPCEASLLFLSRIAPKKNLLFLLECLRSIPATLTIRLTIAGPSEDAAYWSRCQAAIDSLPPHVVTKTVGAIRHDRVRSLISEHHCFVLPTFGENYGHSIVEAFGAGRPVIISDQTPWRNLKAIGAGWDLALNNGSSFAAAIAELAAMDQGTYDRMATAAWRHAIAASATDELTERYAALLDIAT